MTRRRAASALIDPRSLAILAAMAGCVHFAAFDDYRLIRQDEPIAFRAAGNDAIQTLQVHGRTFQAIPVELSVDPAVAWTDLAQGVSANRKGVRFGAGPNEYYLIASDSIEYLRSTIAETGNVYLFPLDATDRFADADLQWSSEQAVSRGLAFLDQHATDPAIKAQAHARLFDVAIPVAKYETGHPAWSMAASAFYLIGVDAIAPTGGAITPASQLDSRWYADIRYPHRAGALPGAFVKVPQGFAGIDSVRILGHWYTTHDNALWLVRPIRQLTVDAAHPEARLADLRAPLDTASNPSFFLVTRQSRVLEALQTHGTNSLPVGTRRLLLVCWNPASQRDECFRTGYAYTLAAQNLSPSQPTQWVATDYNFRVLTRSWSVSFIVGTALIVAFLEASTYR